MITLKLNFRQFNHALMTTPKGTKCLVIPIAENNLFEGEKGIYLDIVGFEIKNPKDGEDTHLLKQSFSKDALSKMTDEAKKALPIIGNARISGGARGESEPRDAAGGKVANTPDDLPF